MSQLSLENLVGKLNSTCREALEAAAKLCLSRTHYNVEIEHWLVALLDVYRGDMSIALRSLGVDPGQVSGRLNQAIDRFKSGNGRPPALAPNIVDLVRDAWLVASVQQSAGQVRSAHLLIALLDSSTL
ncbi:MAG: Clp protease N-terminal domain-containing protein, partial [Planctomycetota bacterium]